MVLEANCSGPGARSPGSRGPLDLEDFPIKDVNCYVPPILVKSLMNRWDTEPGDREKVGVGKEGDFKGSSLSGSQRE